MNLIYIKIFKLLMLKSNLRYVYTINEEYII